MTLLLGVHTVHAFVIAIKKLLSLITNVTKLLLYFKKSNFLESSWNKTSPNPQVPDGIEQQNTKYSRRRLIWSEFMLSICW